MAHLHSENDRKHLGWDDPVPSSIANKWKRFRVNMEDISKIRIPRSVRYTPDFSHDIQLHAFCDGKRKPLRSRGPSYAALYWQPN